MSSHNSSNVPVDASSPHAKVIVASDFALDMHIWNGLIYEIATMTAGFHGTQVVNATGRKPKDLILDRLLNHKLPADNLPGTINSESSELFFYVCNVPRSLAAMKPLENIRRRAKKSVAFIVETWSAQTAKNKNMFKALDNFDHVFLFNETSVPAVQALTKARCSYLPSAIDTLRACSYPLVPERIFDAFAMGRCEDKIHEDLKEQGRQGNLFYFFENFGSPKIRSYEEARARTYDLINRSKLFLCFNHDSGDKALEAKGEAAIPNRIFEGIGAGGVLIGTAPRTKSFGALFDWEDSFIEASLDPVEFRLLARELLDDKLRLQKASLRNMVHSLRHLDWVYRWESVLGTIGMDVTSPMKKRKEDLTAMANLVEHDLTRLTSTLMSAEG